MTNAAGEFCIFEIHKSFKWLVSTDKVGTNPPSAITNIPSSACSTFHDTVSPPPTAHWHPSARMLLTQLYGSTPSEEDLSGRLVLRADGHVVGGPTVRKTTEVEWSDPEGLKPVGGKWSVYVNEKGQSRLELTLVLSFKKAEQLEMDGVVMMVEGWNNETQQMEAHPQIFGSVFRRLGKTEMEDGEGDFSMIKTAKEGKLVATVGSQQGRIW